MWQLGKIFCWDEEAATMAEYALMVGLIAVVCVGAVRSFGWQVWLLSWRNTIAILLAL